MKRSEVRAFIKEGVDDLDSSLGYGSGRISDFNAQRSNSYPFAWLEVIFSSPEMTAQGLPVDNYEINLHIFKKDSADSTPDQYEAIIDQCDLIAQKLMNKYNNSLEDHKLVTISGYSRTPFIKKHADLLTGVVLSFTMNIPDATDVC